MVVFRGDGLNFCKLCVNLWLNGGNSRLKCGVIEIMMNYDNEVSKKDVI